MSRDLSKLCDPLTRFERPFRVGAWECATDGKGLALQSSDTVEPLLNDNTTVDRVLEILSEKRSDVRRVSLNGLRAWALATWPCPQCAGSGSLACMCHATENAGRWTKCSKCLGSKVCDRCDCGEKHRCGPCFGTGEQPCEECDDDGVLVCAACGVLAAYLIDSVLVDRRLLARFLAPFDREETVAVDFDGALDPVRIHGADWIVVVMPMSRDPLPLQIRGEAFVWPETKAVG